MNYDKNYLTRTYWQLTLVFVVVFILGAYKNGKAMIAEKENEIVEISLPESLAPQVAFDSSYKIPDIVYGSDEKWEETTADIDNETVILVGDGYISRHHVTVKCKYNLINGAMTGRYHNENGTARDLNGQMSPSGDKLEINLGHKSDKTFSKWILYPVKEKTEQGKYAFQGHWGKYKKKSEIIFTLE